MLTIYKYSHDAISYIEVSFMVATEQPLAGDASAEESARIITPVRQVASLEEARSWIEEALPAAMLEITQGEFEVEYRTSLPWRPEVMFCATAYWEQ